METKTNLKTTLGIVGMIAAWVWADAASLTWILFAIIACWILWVSVLSRQLDAARLRKRS